MRAACSAVQKGKQVAVLVPTTVQVPKEKPRLTPQYQAAQLIARDQCFAPTV
jgi:formate hydrogenlyase subunit 6/NADH:ubiquinone oxidoreductase subunit I